MPKKIKRNAEKTLQKHLFFPRKQAGRAEKHQNKQATATMAVCPPNSDFGREQMEQHTITRGHDVKTMIGQARHEGAAPHSSGQAEFLTAFFRISAAMLLPTDHTEESD